MKEYLSVKDYAAAVGMSQQAVYKNIKSGKLATEEQTIDGKRKKVVILDRGQAEPTPAGADPGGQDDVADRHRPKVDPDEDERTKALEKAVEALTKQLEEKDRQIASLMDLLSRQQELQAHSQLLLSQPETDPPPIQEEKPEPPEPEVIEKPKRRGFWEWWFS